MILSKQTNGHEDVNYPLLPLKIYYSWLIIIFFKLFNLLSHSLCTAEINIFLIFLSFNFSFRCSSCLYILILRNYFDIFSLFYLSIFRSSVLSTAFSFECDLSIINLFRSIVYRAFSFTSFKIELSLIVT